MIDFTLVFNILLLHLVAVMSPGPDFLVVTKNALTYSKKIGVWTAIGIACGISIHVFYGIGGIALVIAQNDTIYNIIKIVGAAYLFYIGVMSLIASKKKPSFQDSSNKITMSKQISIKKAFGIGFWTNVMNPKATMFFLSVFSAMIPQQTTTITFVMIGSLLILNTGLWFVLVSYVFSNSFFRKKYLEKEHLINLLFGVLLISLAIKIVFF